MVALWFLMAIAAISFNIWKSVSRFSQKVQPPVPLVFDSFVPGIIQTCAGIWYLVYCSDPPNKQPQRELRDIEQDETVIQHDDNSLLEEAFLPPPKSVDISVQMSKSFRTSSDFF